MRRPFLIIRPEPGGSQSLARAAAAGLNAIACPLFAVAPLCWDPTLEGDYRAILFTSANAIRHSGAGLAAMKHLPAYCVGPKTAEAARNAGFRVADVGDGGVETLARRLPKGKIVHLCGKESATIDAGLGTIDRRIVYRSSALAPPLCFDALLEQHPVVALHSVRAAAYFSSLASLDRHCRQHIALCCISAQVADAAGEGWEAVAIALNPSDDEIIKCARSFDRHMGQDRHDG